MSSSRALTHSELHCQRRSSTCGTVQPISLLLASFALVLVISTVVARKDTFRDFHQFFDARILRIATKSWMRISSQRPHCRLVLVVALVYAHWSHQYPRIHHCSSVCFSWALQSCLDGSTWLDNARANSETYSVADRLGTNASRPSAGEEPEPPNVSDRRR